MYLFLESKGGIKRGKETSMCGCLSSVPLLGTWPATQADTHPDWESNQWSFGLQASTQSTEPHQPELFRSSFFIWAIDVSFLYSYLLNYTYIFSVCILHKRTKVNNVMMYIKTLSKKKPLYLLNLLLKNNYKATKH